MSNTTIQILRSTTSAAPSSLLPGQPAYSFVSDKLFVGNTTNHVLTIGGKYYVDQIDAATNAATGSTIVKRDANGSASFNVVTAQSFVGSFTGNAETATKLQTARDIALSGSVTGNVLFDGSSDVTITTALSNSGVTAGTYGGASDVPVFTVGADGRITSASNVSIATSLSIAGDTGTDTLALATDTLTIQGGDGVTTSVDSGNNKVVIDVDNTVIRTLGGAQTIETDLTIKGNVVVQGNTIYQDIQTYRIADPLAYLAANNYTSDSVDIGYVGNYFDGTTQRHTGVVRKSGTNDVYIFTNYDEEFDNNTLNIANPSLTYANVHANLVGGVVEGLASVIKIADGGTNNDTFTTGQITYFDGTKIASLANTGTAGTYGSASYVPVVTTDAYGRVSSVSNTQIAIDASQITSGKIGIAQGGSNNDTYTTGSLLFFDGTKFASLANTTYVGTGTLSTSNTITSVTVDSYGRLTATTSEKIAIDASQVTTGTLGVARGGLGVGTLTQNGVLLGNGTDAVTTVSSVTEGHVLQINASGVPVFGSIDGGTF